MKKSTTIWIVLIIIVIIILFATKNKDVAKINTLVAEENAVVLSDQIPEENLIIQYAKLKKPGYVAVHKKNKDGTTTIMGQSALLPAGEYFNVEIQLTGGSISEGDQINAQLYLDNGDEIFDTTTDTAIEGLMDEASVSAGANLLEVNLESLLVENGYTVLNNTENSDSDDIEDTEDDTETEEETIGETMLEGSPEAEDGSASE